MPDPEGLALWRDGEVTWLVRDRPVARAVPDLTGGVLFQYVDLARVDWHWDDAASRWVAAWPDGDPEPIYRQRVPGGRVEVAVATEGSRLWLLDTAIVDGAPTVAYGRLIGGDDQVPEGFENWCDQVGIAQCGGIAWHVELTTRPVAGGTPVDVAPLWWHGIQERSSYVGRLGEGHNALSVFPAPEGGEHAWGSVMLLDKSGQPVAAPYRADPWCAWCMVVADLPPSGETLAYLEQGFEEWSIEPTGPVEAVLVDTATWTERWRIALPADGHALDTDGERALVTVGGTCEADEPPELTIGDEGRWVERLQAELNRRRGAGLVADGVFGPATERAVRAYQESVTIEPTGWVDAGTWQSLLPLLPDRSCETNLLLIDGETIGSIDFPLGWGDYHGPNSTPGGNDRVRLWVGPLGDVRSSFADDVPPAERLGPSAFGTELAVVRSA